MKKASNNEMLKKIIIGYAILCIVCVFIVSITCSHNANWMSYMGSFLGGILGGLATLIAIYFTLASLKQDVMAYIIPMRTMIYGYYAKGKGVYISTECIEEDMPQIGNEYVENHKIDFNPFNTTFMKFVNVGKDLALNVRVEWSKPEDSKLYELLIEYGIPEAHFDKSFNLKKTVTLYSDYMVPIKIDSEAYSIQITGELIELIRCVMGVFMGAFKQYAKDNKAEVEFHNSFIKKKHEFAKAKVTFEDLNGNITNNEYSIYCRIQDQMGYYNGGFNRIQIELSTCDIIN